MRTRTARIAIGGMQMGRRELSVLAIIGSVAMLFATGCPVPTIDLNGNYGYQWALTAVNLISVETTFPATTFTGFYGELVQGPPVTCPISGTINGSNQLSFVMPDIHSNCVSTGQAFLCTGLDDNGDGTADRLSCYGADYLRTP